VQWKIARPGRWADRFNRWALRRGFPALAWLAPRAPRWFLLLGARWVIALVMFLYPQPKAAIARNLARVLGEPPGARRVRRATREMLRHFAFYWVDLFRFAQLPPGRLRELVVGGDLAAIEPLRRAHAAGRPTILITAHLGNWELGAVLAGQAELPLAVVYVPDAFGEAERYRSLLRRNADLVEIPLRLDDERSSLPVLRALAEGRIVALQGDRDFNDRGVRRGFLGAEASFPLGPFLLARMSGAALVPTFITYTRDDRFEVELGEPIEVERSGDRMGDALRALDRWLAVLERAVRRWPTQWYNFHDFWEPEAARAAESAPGGARGPASERAAS
jgi:KDO2-lipid IV(A) lauroyltransferase